MRSDPCLRSSSLPDPSKRPLRSIVTNEGPSKRSYVASSSKQPSRVFPAVDSFIRRLPNDSFWSKRIRPIIDNSKFGAWRLEVGEGTANDDGISIKLPPGTRAQFLNFTDVLPGLCLPDDNDTKLIDTNLDHLHDRSKDEKTTYFGEPVILAAKNTDVDSPNNAAR